MSDASTPRQGSPTVTPLPPAARFVFRGRGPAIEAAGTAFGVALPIIACRAAEAGDRAALWLGPDEWLLLAPEAESLAIEGGSLVDVSHRQVGLAVAGRRAARLLNAGCPLDLDLAVFPIGMCTRTVFAKAEIVLWRRAETEFRIEVWRSFSAYVSQYLEESVKELDIY